MRRFLDDRIFRCTGSSVRLRGRELDAAGDLGKDERDPRIDPQVIRDVESRTQDDEPAKLAVSYSEGRPTLPIEEVEQDPPSDQDADRYQRKYRVQKIARRVLLFDHVERENLFGLIPKIRAADDERPDEVVPEHGARRAILRKLRSDDHCNEDQYRIDSRRPYADLRVISSSAIAFVVA